LLRQNPQFHPLGAQGGNSAIETAAALANNITKMLQPKIHISDADIQGMFEQVQNLRKPRTKRMQQASNRRQRVEAMENAFLKFTALNIIPYIGKELVFRRFYTLISPAIKLDYLEVPRRPRLAPFHDELPAKPQNSSKATVACIVLVMLSLAGFAWACLHQRPFENAMLISSSVITPANDEFARAIFSWPGILGRDVRSASVDFRISSLVSLLSELDATQRLTIFYFSMMLIPYIVIWIIDGISNRLFFSICS
jgi:hypothetical protein